MKRLWIVVLIAAGAVWLATQIWYSGYRQGYLDGLRNWSQEALAE